MASVFARCFYKVRNWYRCTKWSVWLATNLAIQVDSVPAEVLGLEWERVISTMASKIERAYAPKDVKALDDALTYGLVTIITSVEAYGTWDHNHQKFQAARQ